MALDLSQLAKGDRVKIRGRWHDVILVGPKDQVTVQRGATVQRIDRNAIVGYQPNPTASKPRKQRTERDRYSFNLPESYARAIAQHKFASDSISDLVNRLLRRLQQAGQQGTPPDELPPTNEYRNQAFSFRADIDLVPFIDQALAASPRSRQAVFIRLLGQASQLSPVDEITTDEAAYDALLVKFQRQWTAIKAIDALTHLKQRCSNKNARKFLEDLERKGWLKLHRSLRYTEPLVTIGRLQYDYMWLTKGLPMMDITALRREIYGADPELVLPCLVTLNRQVRGFLIDAETAVKFNFERTLRVDIADYRHINDLFRDGSQWMQSLGKEYDAVYFLLRPNPQGIRPILVLMSNEFDLPF